MRRSAIQQRPETFLLKYDHPLANGLVFAGLGNTFKSIMYNDSFAYCNHCSLTNMVPATSWIYNSYTIYSSPNVPSAQRYHLIFKQNNQYLKFGVRM